MNCGSKFSGNRLTSRNPDKFLQNIREIVIQSSSIQIFWIRNYNHFSQLEVARRDESSLVGDIHSFKSNCLCINLSRERFDLRRHSVFSPPSSLEPSRAN